MYFVRIRHFLTTNLSKLTLKNTSFAILTEGGKSINKVKNEKKWGKVAKSGEIYLSLYPI